MIRNEEAVSPVIGVILMVAITVILAAVIAAFVFGLVGTQAGSKNVGLTVATNTTGFTVTMQGGTDIGSLNNLTYTINGEVNTTAPSIHTGSFSVGNVYYKLDPVTNSRLIIIGAFNDGSTQVLYDRQF